MKKFKAMVIILFISMFTIFTPQTTYADTPYLNPKLQINDKGIRFDAENSTFDKTSNSVGAINRILEEYRIWVVFGSGMTSFIMMGLFIINFMKLANSKGNPQARQKATSGLIFTGVGTALTGSVTLITQLFYNFL